MGFVMSNIKLLLGKTIDLYSIFMDNEYLHVYFKDRDSRFVDASLALTRAVGCHSSKEIIGKTDYDFFSKDFASETRKEELNIMETGVPLVNKIERLIWLSRDVSWMQVNKYPLCDKNGDIVGTWGTSSNVTALTDEKQRLEEANSELKDQGDYYRRQCVIDDMTELFNRRKFFEELDSEFKRIKQSNNNNGVFCISFLDIDNFKSINDKYGHQFGDFTLSKAAAIIRANARVSDIVFRYGGDEFLVIYKKTNKHIALEILERISAALRATSFVKDGVSAQISISGGIASSAEADNIDQLIHIADMRLYEAKQNGKDKIIV